MSWEGCSTTDQNGDSARTIQSADSTFPNGEPVEIQLYTVEVVASIMAAAENAAELVPFLAVSFFCGIRRAEALRLDWSGPLCRRPRNFRRSLRFPEGRGRVKPKQLFLPGGGRLLTDEELIVRSPSGTATVPAVRIDYKGHGALKFPSFGVSRPERSLVDTWRTLSRWQRCHSRRTCQEYGPPPRGYQRAMFRSSNLTASTEAVIPYRFGPAFLASECWRLAGHQATRSGWSILSA